MNDKELAYREGLKEQIKKLYENVEYTQKAHIKDVDIVSCRTNCLKNWQIVFSAGYSVGLVGSFIPDGYWGKIISLLFSGFILGVNLYFKNFNADEIIHKHNLAANELWQVMERYRSLITDFMILDTQVIIKRRDSLIEDTDNIYVHSIPTTSKGYKKAVKAIHSNE